MHVSSWRSLGRRAASAPLLALALSLGSPARAQEQLHYEPPPVDAVYPLAEPTGSPGPEAAAEPPPFPSSAGPTASPPKATPSSAPIGPAPAPAAPESGEYGAQATIRRTVPAGAHEVGQQSARDLPGSFGDPLRVLEALPGVVPIASGVPYVYVRGSPPASQSYVYDDIPLPQLFHAAFGPAVVHPRAIHAMRFHAGVPPARYGRRAGGLLLAEATPYARDFDAELELRLIDLGAWVQGALGDGEIMVSGRLGYPKLALLAAESLGAVDPGTKLNYWDGQLRVRHPLGAHDHAELIWLGSFDAIRLPGVSSVPGAGVTDLQFQRVEVRLVHRVRRGEIGSALRFGYDQSALGSALSVRGFTLGPRIWSELKLGAQRLRVGGDMFVSQGNVVNGSGSLGSPDGDLRIQLPRIAAAPARAQGGLHVESALRLSERVRLDLGARFDYWSVQSDLNFAFDPRLLATVDCSEAFSLHAAFGLSHQPAVFFFPLPGLTEVALDRGLTRSIQSELGAAYQLPASLRLELTGFVHHYTGLLLPELVTDAEIADNPPLSDALAYGMELFLKRDLGDRLIGWIGYTLGWASAESPRSIGKFRPDFDVRHVLNAVASVRVFRELRIGGRLHARSGRLIEQLNPNYEQRLPWFVRGDVRIGYSWRSRFADMVAYIEWLNVGAQGEYLDAECLLGSCKATRAPPISIPNLGVRAEF